MNALPKMCPKMWMAFAVCMFLVAQFGRHGMMVLALKPPQKHTLGVVSLAYFLGWTNRFKQLTKQVWNDVEVQLKKARVDM